MKITASYSANKRVLILLAAFAFAFLLASARLFYLQVINYDFYRDMSVRQRTRIIELSADRGDILDRSGAVLATSIDAPSVFLTPAAVKDKEGTSNKLARILGVNRYKVLTLAYSDRSFAWVERKVSGAAGKKISSLGLPGVGMLTEKKRIYPSGSLASQVLGFVGVDNQALAGIELGFDKYLKGEEGRFLTESDPSGRELVSARHRQISQPTDGLTVTLTIDEAIQYLAEKELERAVKEHGAKSGTIMVMDVKTGELLAVASKPDFDPNLYQRYPAERRRSIGITDVYEPGSTFKLLTVASALNEGVIGEHEKIECPDTISIGGNTIRNSHQLKPEERYTDAYGILAHSINTGTSKIGMRLGEEKWYAYLKAFGFGRRTEVGIPGEPRGILRDLDEWSKPDIAVTSFGQGIAVTPLQLLCAVSALANGGIRVKPMLVKRIESPDGSFVKAFQPEEYGRVVSESTSKTLKEMMEWVVIDGTGKRAKIAGFRVGGKTGTAQKVRPDGKGYWAGHYVSSFIGVAPMSDPRLACLVVIDDPSGVHWGEVVAAPSFARVMEDALRRLNIRPDDLKKAALPR